MNSTPFIARDILGLAQHIKYEDAGLLPERCIPEYLLSAMDFVKRNFNELSHSARKSYEDIWSENNWNKYYDWLIKLLEERKHTKNIVRDEG